MTTIADANRVHLGVNAANIAGNIDAILPQFAGRGIDVLAVGNQIHGLVWDLRLAGTRLMKEPDAGPDQVVVIARQIKSLLPQLSGKNTELDGIVHAVNGYTTQMISVHAEHQRTLIAPVTQAQTLSTAAAR